MPRFFFHDLSGPFLQDTKGIDLPDPAAARSEAVVLVSVMLADRPRLLDGDRHVRVQVTGPDGVAVVTVVAFAIEPGAKPG